MHTIRNSVTCGRRCLAVALLVALLAVRPSGADMLTNRYDNARTGWNPTETTLNTTNVNPVSFGKLWSREVDGQVYAQPLYMAGLAIPGKGVHNVVFAATEHNTVYAFDADSAAPPNDAPLWTTSIGPAVPESVVGCGDIDGPEYGITSTPVIDPSTGLLYVVGSTLEDGQQLYRLHALDVHTGQEAPGWPVVIQGSVPGDGGGSQNGRIAFQPAIQLQRPGLLLVNGTVWVGFGSHCDNPIGLYHGWMFGYNAHDPTTLPQVFCTSPEADCGLDDAAGIWQCGQGPAADAAGDIYFMTGNGSVTADVGGRNVGFAVVRLRPHGAATYQGPAVERHLLDLSSAGLAGQASWRLLVPAPSKELGLENHELDYANPTYDDSGTDPFTGAQWKPLQAPGLVPSPANVDYVMRLRVTLPASWASLSADTRLFLQCFDVADGNLGTYVNGTMIGRGSGTLFVYRFPVVRSAVHPGAENVITIIGHTGFNRVGFPDRAPVFSAERTYSASVPAGGLFNANPDDYYVPNESQPILFPNNDTDLGSGGATLLPDQPGTSTPHLLVGAGKSEVIHLVNRDHLGGFTGRSSASAPDHAVQNLGGDGPSFGSPGYWESATDHFVYLAAQGDSVRQFRLGVSGGRSALTLVHKTRQPIGSGATPSISSDGSRAGTGIVWLLSRDPNLLIACDAQDVSRVLYSSASTKGRDDFGEGVKFTVPTPIDGKVFVGAKNRLVAFGLLTKPTLGGAVTVGEVTVALRIAVGLLSPSALQLSALDVNHDGKVDSADVGRLLQMALGL